MRILEPRKVLGSMASKKLTEKSVASLPVPTDVPQAYYWDTDTTGLGLVVGRTGRKTFVARAWVGKKKRRVVIGVAGEPRLSATGEPLLDADGRALTWTVAAARDAAKVHLGTMAAGIDPNAAKHHRAGGPTLREALDFHISKMERGENRRGKACSPRSIRTTRGSVELHLADYLDRPLVELTIEVIRSVMSRIEAAAERVDGSNPENPPGRAAANRIIANVSAIWRSYEREHERGLSVPNPTRSMYPAAFKKERETRIADDGFAAWYARVTAADISPVRRDLQLVALFMGIRTDGIRNLRWDDVDFDEDLIFVARAKGDKPYYLPMVETVRDILEKRKIDNASSAFLSPFGGDQGFVFPSLSRDGKHVIAVAEVKERRNVRDEHGNVMLDEDGDPVRENVLPGIHVSRRTFNSVAAEIGIDLETREALMNHSGRGVNVKHYVQAERFDHLRACAEKIETALWERIRGTRPAKNRRRKLQSVA